MSMRMSVTNNNKNYNDLRNRFRLSPEGGGGERGRVKHVYKSNNRRTIMSI